MTPIPVYLLTGYLGSGKTSVLNHLVANPPLASSRVALVVNEFGALGVDGQTVTATGGGVFELNSGSLFCACTRSGLVKILDRIGTAVRPDAVLAEATGVAETSDLYDVLETPPLKGLFRIETNVCVVDCLNFTKVLPYLRTARTQVEAADGLALNKTDLLRESGIKRLSGLLRDINGRANQIRVTQGQLDWRFVSTLKHAGRSPKPRLAPPEHVVSCSLQANRANRQRLVAAIDTLGESLLRLKGIVDLGEGPRLVESVFGSYSEKPVQESAARFGLTAIGWKIEQAALQAALEHALEPGPMKLRVR